MDASAAGSVRIGDLEVPRMGFGAMRLPGPRVFGPPADRAEAVRVVRRAVELGVRVIDTAWYYGPDVAHEVIAEALRPYPPDLVLATKLGAGRGPDGSWFPARSPAELRAGCERDLRLLRLDAVPLTHLRWEGADESGRFADALETFVALRDEGKIERIGLSNVTAELLDTALEATEVVTVSNSYTLTDTSDEPMLRRCERDGIAYLPFFPLAIGRAGAAEAVRSVAAELDASPTQVVLAWLLARSPAMLPIPGTAKTAHLEENVAAAEIRLSAGQLDRLGP